MTLSHFLDPANWAWNPLTILLLVAAGAAYVVGWVHLRRAFPHRRGSAPKMTVGSGARLFSFTVGLTAIALATLSPLANLYDDLLLARSTQQVLMGLIAPPFLWLAVPFHAVVRSMPFPMRRAVLRHLRPDARIGRTVRAITRPQIVWPLTFFGFLVWLDGSFLQWSLAAPWRHYLGLWALWGLYMLFWWHAVNTGPRIHKRLPVGVIFAYMVLGGEVPNLIAGVSLAFRETIAYPHYATTSGPALLGITHLLDQTMSGGLIWVAGSFVYVIGAILILGKVFDTVEAPPPPSLDWIATERTLAPGLEHRGGQSGKW